MESIMDDSMAEILARQGKSLIVYCLFVSGRSLVIV